MTTGSAPATEATEATERRRRRAAAQEVFDGLAAAYLDLPEVSRAPMFGSNGLRCHDRLFAFVGGDGEMIVKLPAAQAAGLVADAQAVAVRIGRQRAREWVAIPGGATPGGTEAWRDAMAAAYRYASALGRKGR